MSASSLTDVAAPAKLNLFLRVVGRRPDGYHLLQSLFVLIDWADRLHFERRSDGRLQRHDLGTPLPADDLCLRAARALQQASGTTYGVDISIDKQLPSGAGLGGGSSDAASVLLALNRLWGLEWSRQRLQAIAVTLGADVPFFVGGTDALVGGIGETLHPIDWPRAWYAVVKPPQGCETRAIFTSPLLDPSGDAAIVAGFLADTACGSTGRRAGRSAPTEALRRWVRDEAGNDLQAPAEALCPSVEDVARWLEVRFGHSRMTGSGSAVYAEAGTGERPMAILPETLPAGWVGRMCRGLGVHPLRAWAPD